MARKIEVEIVGDSRSLERAFGRASSSAKKFNVSLGSIVKSAAVFGIIGSAVAGVSTLLGTAVSEWKEMATVAAQTNAVLKATGGVANVTAGHVDKLAKSVSAYSGEDDEAVQAAENLLLTFKAVKNEVGSGNNIFDRATRAAVDLARAGFGSLSTNAKQLGKVLNDPVKGMTALTRAGVTFTAGQRATIKHLAETGHLLEAQRLVLKEVESQVGGSAKAYGRTLPGQLSRLRESFRNTMGGLAQVVARPLGAALGHVNNFIDRFQKAKGVKTKFKVAVTGLEDLGRRIFTLARNAIAKVNWTEVVKTAQAGLVTGLRRIADALNAVNWGQVGRRLGDAIATGMKGAAEFLRSVDWSFVGERIVKGIAAFLTSVNWKAVAIGVFKLLQAAVRAVAQLVIGIGRELGKQLLAGIGKGVDAGTDFILEKLLAFVNKVLGITGFLGRFDPFKGVRAKVQKQLAAMQADTRSAVGKINTELSSITNSVLVKIKIDTVSTFDGKRRPEEGGAQMSVKQGRAQVDARAKAAAAAARARSKAQAAAAAVADRAAQDAKAAATKAAARAKKAADARDKAFASVMDSLSLKFDKAAARQGFKDDLAVLAEQERAVRAQIAAAGKSVELERELFRIESDRKDVREQMRQLAKDQADKAAGAQQARQFKALGLSATGEEKVPGVENLRKQLGSLSERVADSPGQVSSKLVARLGGVRKLLSGAFGKLSDDTRSAIKDLFDAIRGEFDSQDKKGPLTKTTGLNTKRIIEGLGLTGDQAREIRGRLSGFNSAGVALASKQTPAGSFTGGPITVESHTTVQLDGHTVAKSVTRNQQKRTRRNPPQRRGPNRGI